MFVINCVLICLQKTYSGQKLAKATVSSGGHQRLFGLWNDLRRDKILTAFQGYTIFPDAFLLLEHVITNKWDWIRRLTIRVALGHLELMHKSYTTGLAASQNT